MNLKLIHRPLLILVSLLVVVILQTAVTAQEQPIGNICPPAREEPVIAPLERSKTFSVPRNSLLETLIPGNSPVNFNLPDLNVAYIMQQPRYDYSAPKNRHAPGDQIQFVGHLANRGSVPSGPFRYDWLIDGQLVKSETHSGLAAEEMITLSLDWTWQSDLHTVKLELDPANEISEISEQNNSVEDRTNALAVGFWVEQSVYDWHNAHQVELGLGSVSWDDWAQRQIRAWNEIFADAVTPLTPQGIIDRVRLDKVTVVPDCSLPPCATNFPDMSDETIDLQWGFPAEEVGIQCGHTCAYFNAVFEDPASLNVANALLHELGHARYLIDLYGLNVYTNAARLSSAVSDNSSTLPVNRDVEHDDNFPVAYGPVYLSVGGELIVCSSKLGSAFIECSRGADGTVPRAHSAGENVNLATVRSQDGEGNLVQGGPKLPIIGDWDDHLYFNRYREDLMFSHANLKYEQHSAYALNRIAGQRPVCGNYNAPCNIGEYLNDIPQDNIVEIRSPGGKPVVGAQIEIYQARPLPGVWYSRFFDGTADITVVTDAQGRASIGSFPFGSGNKIVHGWGYSNGVIMLKIVAGGEPVYKFLDVTTVNVAFWSGNEDVATYVFELDVTPTGCQILPGNILQNSCFEVGEAPWRFYSDRWGSFETTTPAYDGVFAARVEIGSRAGNIQLYQNNLPLEPNQQYRLYFAAKANNSGPITLFVHKHDAPYTNYILDRKVVKLTTEWQQYGIDFTTNSAAGPDGRLRFFLAPNAKAGTVYWFDNVYLIKVTDGAPPAPVPNPQEPPVPPPGHCSSPISGNVVLNPGFEASKITPWSFYTDGKGTVAPDTSTAYECAQSCRVEIQQRGSNVQLFQPGLALQPNTAYQLRLAAKSSDGQDVRLYLQKHRTPYTNYGLNGLPLDLSREWQTFVVQFTTANFRIPVEDGRLRIWLAGSNAANVTYYVDDVVLVPLQDNTASITMRDGVSVLPQEMMVTAWNR